LGPFNTAHGWVPLNQGFGFPGSESSGELLPFLEKRKGSSTRTIGLLYTRLSAFCIVTINTRFEEIKKKEGGLLLGGPSPLYQSLVGLIPRNASFIHYEPFAFEFYCLRLLQVVFLVGV
jgi:hypothetical protein